MFKWLARSYKVYTKEEILKPFFNRPYKNLIEMAGSKPNDGIGMKFFRKTWPENSYFQLTRIEFYDCRHGKAWGIKTWQGVSEDKERIIPSPLKLGTWLYEERQKTEEKLN